VTEGDRVVVIGGGPIGVLIGLVCQARGATVLLSEPDVGRRQLAAEIGLKVIDPVNEDLPATVDRWTSRAGADVAFEVSGSSAGVSALTSVLKVRGIGVVVALHSNPVPIDLFKVFWRELELRGTRLYERTDFEAAIDLLRSGVIPATTLISAVEPAERSSQVFKALADGGPVMKILIDCQTFPPVEH
jgi:threonine dehydrogenase-like Zn-dependent dehydrogenase